MTNRGKIKSVDGDFAIISVVREGSCGDNCAMCNACKYKTVDVKAYNSFDLNIGDYVEFESNTFFVYFGLLMLFIIPVVFPIAAYLLLVSYNNYIAGAAAFISLIISLFLIFLLSKSRLYLNCVTPRVIKVIKY